MEYMSEGADVPAEVECPICRQSFQDPTRPSSCSHVFCRSCLTQSLRMRPHCPLCRTPTTAELILPAPEILACVGQTAHTQRACRSNVRDRIRRHGMALPLADPFSTVSGRRLATSIQERLRLLNASLEDSQNLAPPAQLQTSFPVILPALDPGVPLPPAPPTLRPVAPTPLPRTLIPQPAVQVPVGPPSNAAPSANPLWTPPPPSLPSSDGAVATPPQDYPSSPSSSSFSSDGESGEMRFTCPYCQVGGMDELDLLQHCNANHISDLRPVVCPICVSLPHGDPTYHSVNFIGHLNLRHRYYNSDFLDVTLNDAISEQAAILASYNSLLQRR